MNNDSINEQPKATYSASITREQFLFFENRIVAKLMLEGDDYKTILQKAKDENIFQLPSPKSVQQIARACYRRLTFVNDERILNIVADGQAKDAKMALLYAFMCENLIIRDFMVDVIGEKYRTGVMVFSINDTARFLLGLGSRVESVGKWSEQTYKKIRGVLNKCLTEAGYLNTPRSKELNPVACDAKLVKIIKDRGDFDMLPAFNELGGGLQ